MRDTVEARSSDTRLIRTPALYGQFRLSRQKARSIFSKINPLYTDAG